MKRVKVVELLKKSAANIRESIVIDPQNYYLYEADLLIDKAIKMLQTSCWYTPDQWKNLTGDSWPECGAVWFQSEDIRHKWFGHWSLMSFRAARVEQAHCNKIGLKSAIICVTNPEPPTRWRPKKDNINKKSRKRI
jgi:hypothetical protein